MQPQGSSRGDVLMQQQHPLFANAQDIFSDLGHILIAGASGFGKSYLLMLLLLARLLNPRFREASWMSSGTSSNREVRNYKSPIALARLASRSWVPTEAPTSSAPWAQTSRSR